MASSSITGTSATAEPERREDFQKKVLQELARQEAPSRRAMLSELAAMLRCMTIGQEEGGLTIASDREEAWKKCFTLLEKTYNIETKYVPVEASAPDLQDGSAGGERVLHFHAGAAGRVRALMDPPRQFEKDERCVRSYLAGEFLCTGCVRSPEKEYYLAFEVKEERQAQETLQLLAGIGITLRRPSHGRGHGVFTRDSAVIVDVLNVLGAHVSMMDMENTRIVRQVRSGVNRKVNCETANIMKTVAASQKQLDEIRLLRTSSIWDTLPETLQQMALLRERCPDSSLQELGERMNPPVGKSGVNHRLRRLSALAKSLQEEETQTQR